MAALNFKHLRYYWMVAKTGSIAKAAEQLHLTAHAISGQINEFEETLGVELFRKAGRNIELTEAGRRILNYADTIFNTSDQLLDELRDQMATRRRTLRIGIADAVPKIIAYRLIQPALTIEEPIRINCREGRLDLLLGELALHKLDLIIADRPLTPGSNVRAYNHLLGECGLTVFATSTLARQFKGKFPQKLNQAPFLIPGEDVAIQGKLLRWFDENQIRPTIVGEFDDGALMKAFGSGGAGFFVAPSAMQRDICLQYNVVAVGDIPNVVEQIYVITTERRLSDPAIVTINQTAKNDIFGQRAYS
ncbi:transcriptional activator NhaR [Undibacterium seohonense]|jgi:LysR family transcriptional activator of nhaA|uniref:Transcriptional activator NhaR n=1 Tax=Undibacterium seohonense TaxID=1344950 RepID=A0ABR6X423_9BURK|nr:transcriptional activator NhaR [Undibacterium seohonense]MBC3807654.1 transcriptional activator NhaR [Undibacterium seohonense]